MHLALDVNFLINLIRWLYDSASGRFLRRLLGGRG
jgi:hypothetical protein